MGEAPEGVTWMSQPFRAERMPLPLRLGMLRGEACLFEQESPGRWLYFRRARDMDIAQLNAANLIYDDDEEVNDARE